MCYFNVTDIKVTLFFVHTHIYKACNEEAKKKITPTKNNTID